MKGARRCGAPFKVLDASTGYWRLLCSILVTLLGALKFRLWKSFQSAHDAFGYNARPLITLT